MIFYVSLVVLSASIGFLFGALLKAGAAEQRWEEGYVRGWAERSEQSTVGREQVASFKSNAA